MITSADPLAHLQLGSPPPDAQPSDAQQQPLTEAQEGLWYAQRLDPRNPVFATAQYVDIRGPLDREALAAAVAQAMREADALAVRIRETEQGPRHWIAPGDRARLLSIDLSDEPDPEAAALRIMQEDLAEAIDLERDPLAVQWLLVLDPARVFWYQRVHHLVIDGYGTMLLTMRICDLYGAHITRESAAAATPPHVTSQGTPPPRAKPFGRYEDLLDADRAYRESDRRASDREFWLATFADRPEAAGLAPGVALTADRYLRQSLELPPETGAALQALSQAADVSWPDVLTALIGAYTARHAGGAEAIVGVASMGRMGTPAARVPAMVMNILPLRVPLQEEAPLADWLREVADRLRRARRHGRYRSEQLRRDLGLAGADRRLYGPLVNVLPFDAAPELPSVEAQLHVLATGPVDDLTITIRASATLDRLVAELDANPRLYDEAALRMHAARLATFIATALGAARLADVPTATPAEEERFTNAVNATAHPVVRTTLPALIADCVAAAPESVALTFGRDALSYAAFDAVSLALAARLLDAGVRRGDIVTVALPRSFELLIALHAVMRIGAAYLPLDLDQPTDRLHRMMRTADPRAAITRPEDAHRMPANVARVTVDDLLASPGIVSAGPVSPDSVSPVSVSLDRAAEIAANQPAPEDAAYVIFTSGSTGEPKGVVIEHHAIVNRLEWMRTHYGVTTADRVLQKTPVTFDVSVWELFLPLIAGATLVIAPPDAHRDPARLAALMETERISLVHFVPTMLAEFLAEPGAARVSPRAVFCSGEALPAALRDRFHRTIRAELHNLYGPTEAAVDVTWWPAAPDDRSDPVPIGFPVWNTQLYVLDDRARPVPPGVTGHLYLAGLQLARGYLGRPDLTRERFVPNPFGPPGSRMYRTGDLARWREDGAVEFLGRSDHQVKIRGQRIELGEIEAALMATGRVARALVIDRRGPAGDTQLVAYVEAPEESFDAAALLADVAGRVPAVMTPSAIVRVDLWPVNANGKLDRAQLPEPARVAAHGRAASTESERRLLALFAETLAIDVETIGIDGDFFALGGHSILAARLIRRLREAWAVDAGLGLVFTHATVSRLASALDELARDERSASESGSAAASASAAAVSGLQSPLPLRDTLAREDGAEKRPLLACVHPAGGIAWCYRHLAQAIDPARPVYGLQAPALLETNADPVSLDALAAHYVAQLRALQPEGPYHLCGWSVGGIIAQAMAAQLEAAGARVGVLALLDAYPSDRWRDAPDADEQAALRALLLMADEDPEAAGALTRASVVARLREGQHPLGALAEATLSRVLRVVEQNNRLVRRHRHAACEATIIHFTAALDHATDGCSADEWQAYARHVERYDLPFVHAHMTGPEASRRIGRVLSETLRAREEGARE